MKFIKRRGTEILYLLENYLQFLSVFSKLKEGEQPMYHNCVSLCSLCEWKEVTKTIYHLFSWITGIKTNMLLIIILGLMVMLMSVSADCGIGTHLVNDFDWIKLGIRVLTWFLKPAASKTATLLHISLVVQLTNCQDSISHCTFGYLNDLWITTC